MATLCEVEETDEDGSCFHNELAPGSPFAIERLSFSRATSIIARRRFGRISASITLQLNIFERGAGP